MANSDSQSQGIPSRQELRPTPPRRLTRCRAWARSRPISLRSPRLPVGTLSQEQLAAASGLHRTYVGSIERSERNVSLDSLNALATGLSTEVWRLLQPKRA
ncbi:helix-turn-helix domain-containing protein [Brevundimonas diminuta]|nr:helix-turn-helix transcriptional regulator [Bordetella sp.]MDA0742340.1 helix-turn-helix transcriptional regulator [Pseudomonadota bacterium]MDA1236000.1 helix-turn-helix transcriptional regulator [Acidobacteriota bacterium]